MPDIDFDKNPQAVELTLAKNEVHFNFARPYVRFNKTSGLYDFDASAQEVHFDIEGSIGSIPSDGYNSCLPDGGFQDDVLVKQSAAKETETVTTQDIDTIILNMKIREIEFHIVNTNAEGEQIGKKKIYFNPFSNMGPAQQQDIQDVLDNIRQYARSIGVFGEGTDSDDISG